MDMEFGFFFLFIVKKFLKNFFKKIPSNNHHFSSFRLFQWSSRFIAYISNFFSYSSFYCFCHCFLVKTSICICL